MARRRSKKVFRSPKLARRQARKRRSMISERRKKEFLWKGFSLDQLKELPLYPVSYTHLTLPTSDLV